MKHDSVPFEKRRGGLHLGVAFLVLLIGVCVLTLPFAMRWYDAQALATAVRQSPSFAPAVSMETLGNPGWPGSGLAYRAVSWMGHDDLGRSLVYRIMPATVISLLIGLSAAIVAGAIGVTWGAVAALAGGRIDFAMMRIVDVLYGLPYILMVILLKTALTYPLTRWFGNAHFTNLALMFLAIGGVSWLTMARVVRGQVLSLRSRAFIDASRVFGAGAPYIVFRHIVPNVMRPAVVCATLIVPQAILQESFLSFLGIGVQPPIPSLGQLAADGVQAVNTFVSFWWLLVFPCAILVGLLLSLAAIGESVVRR